MTKSNLRLAVMGFFVVLFLVASAGFVRAVRKATSEYGCEDFAILYSASRAWRTGVNPYDNATLAGVWAKSGGPVGMGPNNYFELSLYPPPTLVALAPWSYASWPVARDAWAFTNVLLILAAMVAMLDLAGISWPDWRVPALLATMLALGAFRNTVNYGQPAAPACAAILLAAALARRRHNVAAGLFLAIALAIKVQIAGPFLAYYVCRKNWRLAGVCIATVALMTGVALLRMHLAGVSWMADWLNNIKVVGATGGINDAAPTGPSRFQLVNLQVILTSLMSKSAANILTMLLVGSVTGWVLITTWLRRSEPTRRTELAELSLMAALGLLALYHRWYDTGTLAFCLAWAAVAWDDSQQPNATNRICFCARWMALAAMLLVVPFFVSLAIKLRPNPHLERVSAVEFKPAAAHAPGSWWLELFVLPNQVWALILMVALFLYARQNLVEKALQTD